jgi:hypothetical protein
VIRFLVAMFGVIALSLVTFAALVYAQWWEFKVRTMPQGPAAVARLYAAGGYSGAGGSIVTVNGTQSFSVNSQPVTEQLTGQQLTVTVTPTQGPITTIPVTLPSPKATP